MGFNALYMMFLILSVLGLSPRLAHAQNPNAGVFSLQDHYQLFSPQYAYGTGLLSDVEVGHVGAVWLARVYGQGAELTNQSSSLSGVDAWFGVKYRLLESLEFLGVFRAKFEAGHTQDYFGDLEPTTGLFMREGALSFTPAPFFNFKAGVISQDWLGMPMLMFRKSFPGALVKLSAPVTNEVELSLISQWLIPTSQTLSTRTVERESTPQFMTNTLGLSYKKSDLNVSASASTFKFRDLPSLIAFESQKRGNSYTTITNPNNSAFIFDFGGWFAEFSVKYRISEHFEPYFSYSRIRNTKAPETYNDGQSFTLGSYYHMDNHIAYLGYERFFVESDVTPALYGSWAYGNTNKQGGGIEAWWLFKKHNFRLRAEYYKAKLINQDGGLGGIQQDQDYFYIGVETGYDRI